MAKVLLIHIKVFIDDNEKWQNWLNGMMLRTDVLNVEDRDVFIDHNSDECNVNSWKSFQI